MRHTFCTMLMSLYGDAAKVATWSRHANASQLYRSYVAKLVSRDEAKRFTAILPLQR
jgi:integrase